MLAAKKTKMTNEHIQIQQKTVQKGIDLTGIHSDLGEIKKSVQATCTKTDLQSAVNRLVKRNFLNDLVTSIVNKL